MSHHIDRNDKILITLQEGGNNPTLPILIFIHAIGGDVFIYPNFASLCGSQYAAYAFRASSLDGDADDPPISSVERLSSRYITALLTHPNISNCNLNNNLVFIGVSFGGLIAFQMATQMATQYHIQVRTVVMLDTPVATYVPHTLGDYAGILEYTVGHKHGVTAVELRTLALQNDSDVLTEARKLGLIDANITPDILNTWLAHEKAMFAYQPTPAQQHTWFGSILFFRPSQTMSQANLSLNNHLPWYHTVKSPTNINIIQVPGDHVTMTTDINNLTIIANHIHHNIQDAMTTLS